MTELERRAKECAGNWLKFESFCWHNQPDDAHDWYIWYTHNRDSDLLKQSNAEQINKSLEQFVEGGDIRVESHAHWAVGWVAGFSVCVYRDGAITPAFIKCAGLLELLEEYPILDEDHFAALEYEAALDGIRQSTRGAGVDTDSLVDEWEYAVFEWLWDNESGELEHDGDGAYPSEEAVKKAVKALFDMTVC